MSAESSNLRPERFAADVAKARKDFHVIQSDDTTLLLDLDKPENRAQFKRVFPKVAAEFGVDYVETWQSKSGNNHTLIKLCLPLPMADRFALQAALGSDGVREALGVKRMHNGVVEPSVLFRPQGSVVHRATATEAIASCAE